MKVITIEQHALNPAGLKGRASADQRDITP
jgi:hypothetical protein